MSVSELLRAAAEGDGTDAVAFTEPLDDAGAEAASEAIAEQADGTRVLALLALRRDRPDLYAAVAAGARAAILADALRTQTFLNDFGGLHGDEWTGPAGEALLELGPAAVPELAPLLADTSDAPLFGSETATVAHDERWRRADYAAHYLQLLLDGQSVHDADPAARDVQIAALRERLGA